MTETTQSIPNRREYRSPTRRCTKPQAMVIPPTQAPKQTYPELASYYATSSASPDLTDIMLNRPSR